MKGAFIVAQLIMAALIQFIATKSRGSTSRQDRPFGIDRQRFVQACTKRWRSMPKGRS